MTAAVESKGRRPGAFSRFRDFLTRRPGFLRNIIIFALTLVVGLAALAAFVGQEDLILPWQHKTTYYADFADASAIAPGLHQEIRVAGVHVGDLGSASVGKGGVAHVQLQITDKSLKVYSNATVLLQAKTPLNEMYLELSPGTPGAPVLKDGQTIPLAQTQSPIEVDQILQHLGPNVQSATRILLEETNSALMNASDHLPNDLASANTTMGNLQPLAQALSTRDSEIKTLVTDLDSIATVAGSNQGRLANLLNVAETTLNTIQANDAPLSQTLTDLPQTTQALGSALPKVQALTGQLNPLLDNVRGAATVLPTALSQLNSTLQNLDPLLNQLRPVISSGNPLVSNLRQYLVSANPSLGVLDQVGRELNPLTAYTAYDMPWLNGFFYNTNSLTSVETSNGKPQVRSLVISGASGVNGLCSVLVGELSSGTNSSITSGVGQTLCNAIKGGGNLP